MQKIKRTSGYSENLPPKPQIIFQLIAKNYHEEQEQAKQKLPPLLEVILEHIGKYSTVYVYEQFVAWLAFVGQTLIALFTVLRFPKRLRFTSITRHMDETGVYAIPIVMLIVFLISVVLAYQGATQLSKFGAEIYTVDLVMRFLYYVKWACYSLRL